MTHLSDFSFLQRMVSLGYLSAWFGYRVWKLDRFRCLSPQRFRQGELKSVVTALILVMIPFQLYYDVTSCKIKYEEGFANVFGHVFTKPETMWTKADRDLVVPTNYSLCIGLSLQTGTLLLLQCFWNYLANSVAKASFMSSREFVFYILWTLVSIIMFPILQYNFSRDVYDPTYKEIMPELVYGVELFIVACLGVVSHFRFRKLLNNSRESNNARTITHKIRYFQELNLILTVVLFVDSISFIILSADGLTGRKTLNAHKFSADFLICNINISTLIVWFLVMLIFHPKPQGVNGQATNDFLSAGKQMEGYTGVPPMMTQASQASSDYLQYSKSVGMSVNSSYNPGTYQFGPLPPPPEVMHPNNSVASSTQSSATLVPTLNNYQSRRPKSMHVDSTESIIDDTTHLPPYRPINNQQQQTLPSSPSPPPPSFQTRSSTQLMNPNNNNNNNNEPNSCQHCHSCQQHQSLPISKQSNPHLQHQHTIVTVDRENDNEICLSHNDIPLNIKKPSLSNDEKRSSCQESVISHHQHNVPIDNNNNNYHLDMNSQNNNSNHNNGSIGRNPNWQLSLDFSNNNNGQSTVKRDTSNDSMWLHQIPKGGNDSHSSSSS
ncbi:hypothetical protein BJ944DRAFT_261080 [Cunninghamella echinulata]|nr:hypothetical protein BJ944DRAFT_261080 [Cunninghamella echinulata]